MAVHTPEQTESGGTALGFGKDRNPFFWIGDNERVGQGTHIAFVAADRATVDRFYTAALAAGGKDNGAPGIRLRYHPNDTTTATARSHSTRRASRSRGSSLPSVRRERYSMISSGPGCASSRTSKR